MKIQWNRLMTMCAFALVASALTAAEMPRSEWLGKIGACAENPAVMTETMSNVSAADQVALVAEVNKALTQKKASTEALAVSFVKANVSALTVAMRQNEAKRMGSQVLAEIYATVPPEHLTVVSEQLVKQVLKRGGLSKEVFITISTNVLHVVTERLGNGENAGVREAFAAVTFIKALGEPATKDLINTMLSQMGDAKTRETAVSEWIGPALGINGNVQSYDPMLGAADAGDEPDHTVVESLLAKDGFGTGGDNGSGNGGNGGNAPANGGTNSNNPANTTNNTADGKTAGDGKTGDGTGANGGANGGTAAGAGAGAGTGANGGANGGTAAGAGTGAGTGANGGANGGTAAGAGAGAGAGANGGTAAGAGAGAGTGAALHPVVISVTGGSDISVALLGDLGAMGSGMQTPIEQVGGGIGLPPAIGGVGGVNDLPSDIGLNRTPRAYVNSPDAVGGNADGKNSDGDGDGDNPYYKKGRGDNGNGGTGGEEEHHGSRPYRGQHLKAW